MLKPKKQVKFVEFAEKLNADDTEWLNDFVVSRDWASMCWYAHKDGESGYRYDTKLQAGEYVVTEEADRSPYDRGECYMAGVDVCLDSFLGAVTRYNLARQTGDEAGMMPYRDMWIDGKFLADVLERIKAETDGLIDWVVDAQMSWETLGHTDEWTSADEEAREASRSAVVTGYVLQRVWEQGLYK